MKRTLTAATGIILDNAEIDIDDSNHSGLSHNTKQNNYNTKKQKQELKQKTKTKQQEHEQQEQEQEQQQHPEYSASPS